MSAPVEPREVTTADVQVLKAEILAADSYKRPVYAEALFLVEHPEVHVSTDADYPTWTPGQRWAVTR